MNRIEDKSLSELIDRYLSEEGIEVFDNVVAAAMRRAARVKAIGWSAASLAAAACIALFVLPSAPQAESAPVITSVQIAEGIQHIMELDLGDVETITAKPAGDKAIITATLRDGSTYSYIMTCNEDNGSTSFFAKN